MSAPDGPKCSRCDTPISCCGKVVSERVSGYEHGNYSYKDVDRNYHQWCWELKKLSKLIDRQGFSTNDFVEYLDNGISDWDV